MQEQRITCIGCPLGCEIVVKKEKNSFLIKGEQCKRGKEYAIQEVTDPRRMLTSTVRIKEGTQKMLPVRSDKQMPKHLIKKAVKQLAAHTVDAPVRCGDVIIHNILDTNINIIATRDMQKG
jgi:CxxC motif-containing protein